MRTRFASSAESAASFIERRKRKAAARRREREAPIPPPREEPPPPPPPAPAKPRRDGKYNRRVSRPEHIGPDTLFVLVALPIATYHDLIDHCRDFGISPQTFVKQSLAQAKLSRGGV